MESREKPGVESVESSEESNSVRKSSDTFSMSRLFRFLREFQGRFLFASSSSVANKVLDLMPPLLVGWVIDSVRGEPPAWIRSVVPGADPFSMALFLAILTVLIFFLESVFQWMYQYGFMTLAQKVQHTLRTRTYDRLQSRELAFFEDHRMGETMAMLNDDVNQLENFMNTGFNQILQLAVLFVFAGIVMFEMDVTLALIGLTPIPLILLGSFYYQRHIAPRYNTVRQTVGELNSRLENNLAGMAVIKSFTAEKFESQRVRQASENYMSANFQAIKLNSVYVPIIRMAVAIGFAGVLLAGAYRILSGQTGLTVGELVVFSMLVQRILWPLTGMGQTLDSYERARSAARRTFKILDTPADIQDPANPLSVSGESGPGRVGFENLVFSYSRGTPILNGLNLEIQPGETLGIAGVTGAGKSTLIKLLLRLYDPGEGAVKLDGVDLRALTQKELRAHIALVSQDVYIFHGTIGENIAYGRMQGSGEVELEKIRAAARAARLSDFVESLPQGYDTLVGERGIKLSGGQRQRLSIARAVLKDAPVLALDEATSSVDTETERAIQENLQKLTAGRTALIIAHRLSTIRHADRIVVLGEGRILEEGRHEELLARAGIYNDLWNIQSGNIAASADSQGV